jgi:SAM-dependent methyltransferase
MQMLGAIKHAIKRRLAHPATRDLAIDDPRTTERRRELIHGNRFLWRIYDDWYRSVASRVPQGAGAVLELGSGAGFFHNYIPGLIASEVFACPGLDVALDARQLPFAPGSLRAIVMVDVFHHIPDAQAFLREAGRALRPGGALLMIEPWVSSWSKLIYTHLHHEPFVPESKEWAFPSAGPLSGANGALPWMVFERDRAKFEAAFPEFEIRTVRPFMPFRYLVSGGVSMRPLMPGAMYSAWGALEAALAPWPKRWPMFALVHVERRA